MVNSPFAPISGSGPLSTTNKLLAKLHPNLYTLYPSSPVPVEVKKESGSVSTTINKVVGALKGTKDLILGTRADLDKAMAVGQGGRKIADTVSGGNGLLFVGIGLVLLVVLGRR